MITDWNAAYSNMDHVPDGPSYPPLWMAAARDYREAMSACGRARLNLAYGPGERHRLDMFLPQGQSAGLVVFVHGGYWRAFDKDVFSHLASGCVDMGHTVALPSYTLCPQARIHEITREIAMAVTMLAGEADGPVTLAGHSAGGHLVARMACTDSAVAGALAGRQVRVVSISGVHDLRPLLMTDMNEILRLDAREARAESVCLLEPLEGTQVTCWVGAEELPEFVRQNDLLANVWAGLGARTRAVHAPGHHHFSVIADMQDKGSALVAELTRGDPGGLTRTPNRTVKFRPVKFRAAGDVQIRAAACKHWREPEQALPCTP